MTSHSIRLLTPTILGTLLAVGCAWPASAGQPVVVHVAGGRQVTAEVAERTNSDQLWLVVRTRSTEVLRPVAWKQVISAEWNGKTLSAVEFREQLATKATATDASQKQVEQANASAMEGQPETRPDNSGTMASEALELLFSSATDKRPVSNQ